MSVVDVPGLGKVIDAPGLYDPLILVKARVNQRRDKNLYAGLCIIKALSKGSITGGGMMTRDRLLFSLLCYGFGI